MAWLVELVGTLLRVKTIVKGDKISSGPLTKREIILLKKEISNLILKGENAYNQDLYSDACKNYIKAYQLERINPDSTPDSVNQLKNKIKQVEDIINEEKIEKLTLIIKRGINLKNEAKFQEANIEYQKGFSIIKDMRVFDPNLRGSLLNEIYFLQIRSLLEQGVKFKSEKAPEKAVETFKKAKILSESMIQSTEKDLIVKEINKNLDTYSTKIREKIKLGNQLIEQKKYDESKQVLQIALNLVKEKYSSLTDSISNRFKETNEVREINSLINQSESEIIKNNSMSKDIKSDGLPVAKEQPSLPSKPSILTDDQTSPTKPLPMQTIKVPISTLTSNIKVEHIIKEKEEVEKEEKPKVTYNTCSFCGTKLNKKARFCPQCGMKSKKK